MQCQDCSKRKKAKKIIGDTGDPEATERHLFSWRWLSECAFFETFRKKNAAISILLAQEEPVTTQPVGADEIIEA